MLENFIFEFLVCVLNSIELGLKFTYLSFKCFDLELQLHSYYLPFGPKQAQSFVN